MRASRTGTGVRDLGSEASTKAGVWMGLWLQCRKQVDRKHLAGLQEGLSVGQSPDEAA